MNMAHQLQLPQRHKEFRLKIVVDKYHAINTKALLDLGCSWEPNIDPRGVEFGGSLFNRTSDKEHYQIVSENFFNL